MAVVGDGLQGDTRHEEFLAARPRTGVQGDIGDGAIAKAEVSGEVVGVVHVPLLWQLVPVNKADVGL